MFSAVVLKVNGVMRWLMRHWYHSGDPLEVQWLDVEFGDVGFVVSRVVGVLLTIDEGWVSPV